MAHIEADELNQLQVARRLARSSRHVQRAQVMLLAAGLASFGIVAVAAAMMTTLF